MAIARALLADPRILIHGEATSSLDTVSEGLVQEVLGRLMEEHTTVVNAHRLSTVVAADRLVVLAEGRIVDEGTHGELIARDGLHARLYAKQLPVWLASSATKHVFDRVSATLRRLTDR